MDDLQCSGVMGATSKMLIFYSESVKMIWVFRIYGDFDVINTNGGRYKSVNHGLALCGIANIVNPTNIPENELMAILDFLRIDMPLGVRGDANLPYSLQMDPSCKSEDVIKILDSNPTYQWLSL